MHPSAVFDDAMRLVAYHRPDIAHVLRTLPIYPQSLPSGSIAVYQPQNPKVLINSDVDFDVDTLAHSLIHEGTHALEHTLGTLPLYARANNPLPLVQSEIRAFTAAAKFWERLYPNGKFPERTMTDYMSNRDLTWMRNGMLGHYITNHYSKMYLSGEITRPID